MSFDKAAIVTTYHCGTITHLEPHATKNAMSLLESGEERQKRKKERKKKKKKKNHHQHHHHHHHHHHHGNICQTEVLQQCEQFTMENIAEKGLGLLCLWQPKFRK